MNVYLSEGSRDQLPSDLILRCTVRSDLAPVPRTVELMLYLKDGIEQRLPVGASFWCGRELLEYEVVKTKRVQGTGLVQGADQFAAYSITALLAPCARIAYRRDRAVVRSKSTFSALYRACGARVAVGNDFAVDRFACLKGQVPSFHLAAALQEEGAAIVLREGRLSAVRLDDLLRQDPVDQIGQADTTDAIESEFLERHEIPAFISIADDGGFVMAPADTRQIRFMPRANQRVLRNASRVLVTRRIIDSDMAQQILAGDVIQVGEERFVVITAAHDWTAEQGIAATSSRFWVGGMSR